MAWEVNLWRDKMKITVDRLVLSASSRLYRYGIGQAPPFGLLSKSLMNKLLGVLLLKIKTKKN